MWSFQKTWTRDIFIFKLMPTPWHSRSWHWATCLQRSWNWKHFSTSLVDCLNISAKDNLKVTQHGTSLLFSLHLGFPEWKTKKLSISVRGGNFHFHFWWSVRTSLRPILIECQCHKRMFSDDKSISKTQKLVGICVPASTKLPKRVVAGVQCP